MSLRRDLEAAAHQAGGGTKTRHARLGTVREYATWCQQNNIQTRRIPDVKSRQISAYVAWLRERGIAPRTIQNRMSHLRASLTEGGGRTPPSNRDLGLAGTRRPPARTAMRDEVYEAARKALEERGSYGERAALGLQRTFGLRASEAIAAVKMLPTWERQTERGERIRVIGKGGRPRDAEPVDRERALAAIREAREVVRQRGDGKLINGGTLEAARSRYERECAAVGLKGKQAPHSARYAYTQERMAIYESAGYDRRAASMATSEDLGHGSGRDRWVRSVYSAREDDE